MSDDADTILLRRFVATRDEGAFAEIVRRQLDGVYSAALRRVGGDVHLAEDVAQLVFVALARKAASVAGTANLAGWLYGATRNEAANVVRSERRRKAREQEAYMMNKILGVAGNDGEADWSRVAPVLDAAIDELGENDRAAILARFVERRAFGEIGAALRVSEDAARMRVERALEKLRGRLARRGVTSTGVALGVALANHAVVAAPVGLAGTVATVSVATAAGPGGAAGALGFIQFMTNTKLAVGVASVLAVGLMGWAVREGAARREAEAVLVVAKKEHAALARTRSELEARARAEEQENARLTKSLADRQAVVAARVSAAATAAAEKTVEKLSPGAEGKLFLARHPEVRQALIEWASAKVLSRWGPFLKARGFSAAQIEEFQILTRTVSLVPDREPDGKTMMLYAGAGLSAAETERRLRALLGEEGYQSYAEIERARPARDFVEKTAGALCFSDTPLTTMQAEQLVRIVDGNRTGGTQPWDQTFDWEAILAQAQGVLAGPQLAVLGGMKAEAEFLLAWNRKPNPYGAAKATAGPGK